MILKVYVKYINSYFYSLVNFYNIGNVISVISCKCQN
jgi:hypothetical protein